MKQALAAVYEGQPGELVLQQLPIPRPGAGEVLVRVLGCTLCGSDLHSHEGRRRVPVPTVLGHEIVGEICELGPQTGHLGRRVGERVTWAIVAHCGTCHFCRADLPQKCVRGVKYGHEAFRPGRELLGGLAEYCLLVPGTTVVPLPEELPLEVACPASCATATIAAAAEAAGALPVRACLVLGAGMLGLTAVAWARHHGAREVVCVDVQPSRRERARSFGATACLAPDEVAGWLADSGHPQGFDIVFELAGQPVAFQAGWQHVRTGGTLVLVGAVFPSAPVPLELEQVVRRQLTLRGVHNYAPRHLEQAVAFLERTWREFPFASLVGPWIPLAQVPHAFELGRRGESIRVGVAMPVRG